MSRTEFISPSVRAKIVSTLEKGGQAMLFLNRRGYAPIVVCGSCGAKIKCKFCDVFLTEHRAAGKLKCHHCNYVREKPQACEACETRDSFRVMGAGVERIQEELGTMMNMENIALLTSDTLTSPSKAKEVIENIEKGTAKVIVGTQVISKGYHFPNLKFVAILDADFGLNVEDFRAFEKTFQLLYQVAGRSGRESEDGEVYIQTFDAKNKVLASISIYDKRGFYELELESRFKFKLPPFSKQIGFVISGEDKDATLASARSIATNLEKGFAGVNGLSIFGPSLAILSYLRSRHRFRILILSTSVFNLQDQLIKILENEKIGGNIFLKVDVDPISFY